MWLLNDLEVRASLGIGFYLSRVLMWHMGAILLFILLVVPLLPTDISLRPEFLPVVVIENNVLIELAWSVVLAPFYETVIFFGLPLLASPKWRLRALVISSFVFGALHFMNSIVSGFAAIMVGAPFLALTLYIWSARGSQLFALGITILHHAAVNALLCVPREAWHFGAKH